MEKPHWFPLYANDFLASNKMAAMTTEEIGAYTLLLCREWSDPHCRLPADDKLLHSMGRFAGDLTRIKACFVKKHGFLYNERLYEEWKKSKTIRTIRSRAGKKGMANRWHNIAITNAITNDITKHNQSQSQSQSQLQLDKEKRRTRATGALADTLDGFDRFWEAYPLKAGRQEAEKAWRKSKESRPTIEIVLEALGKQNRSVKWTKDNGEFIPRPSTWLNQARWADRYDITIVPPMPITAIPKSFRKLASNHDTFEPIPDDVRDILLHVGVGKDMPT